MTASEGEDPNELVVLMKVLDILKLRIQARDLHNHESVQIVQITNQLLPGSVIGDFIQATSLTAQGDAVMGDKYEAHGNASVGAMGKQAHVSTVIFGGAAGDSLDGKLVELAEELRLLRIELRSRASTVDEDEAVVAVGQAIAAADDGDAESTAKHLKSAGKWALGVATSIGSGVAATAIQNVLGL